jgi:hypothetical protein
MPHWSTYESSGDFLNTKFDKDMPHLPPKVYSTQSNHTSDILISRIKKGLTMPNLENSIELPTHFPKSYYYPICLQKDFSTAYPDQRKENIYSTLKVICLPKSVQGNISVKYPAGMET